MGCICLLLGPVPHLYIFPYLFSLPLDIKTQFCFTVFINVKVQHTHTHTHTAISLPSEDIDTHHGLFFEGPWGALSQTVEALHSNKKSEKACFICQFASRL